jgi:hypothetical protein
MCTYVAYYLRIEGRLPGLPHQNWRAIKAFQDHFDRNRPESGMGPQWPHGFVDEGFEVKHWDAYGWEAPERKEETVLGFFAYVSRVLPRKTYENGKELKDHFAWLLSYREQRWYKELQSQLADLNGNGTLNVPSPHLHICGWGAIGPNDGGNS